MKLMSNYYNFIKKLYEKEESGLALALFRIVYGLVVFAEVWQIFYFRHWIFDPIPYVNEGVFLTTPALIIWMLTLFFITIGFFTRFNAFLNYLFTILFLGFSFGVGEGVIHEYHIDTELLTVAIVLIFMPISQRLSVDRLIKKLKYSTTKYEYEPTSKIPNIHYIILALAAGLIYFDSIFFKATSPMWLSGLGVWLPASLPWAAWLDLSFILNQEYLIKFLGYLTLAFQTTYIFLVWFKKFKVPFLLIGIGLHLGIFFAFPIPWFALAMIALYIGLIPSTFYSNLYEKIFKSKKKPTLKFYFDENCPLCNRLRIIVQYFDNSRNIEFLAAQQEAHKNALLKNIPIQQLLDNVYSVDDKNNVFSGIETYVKVLNKVWIFKPIGILLYIPFIKAIGSKIYGYIAQHRITYGCTEDSCSIPTNNITYIEKDDTKIKILQNLDLKTIKIFLLASFILFFALSQLIIIQKAPLTQNFYEKIGLPEVFRKGTNYLANVAQTILYPITGFESHGVFMDHHFKNYTNIYNLYFIDANNNEIRLPLSRDNGLVDWMNTSRQWRYWTFSTIGSNGNIKNINPNLERILAFWSYKNDIDIKNATFILKQKSIKVVYKWEKDLLKNNMKTPWEKVGTLGWENSKFYSNIVDIENKKD